MLAPTAAMAPLRTAWGATAATPTGGGTRPPEGRARAERLGLVWWVAPAAAAAGIVTIIMRIEEAAVTAQTRTATAARTRSGAGTRRSRAILTATTPPVPGR